MSKEDKVLEKNRKQVMSFHFEKMSDINVGLLTSLIQEALLINEW